MSHPELEDLAAYIEGKLSPAERDAITAHLAECDECFQVFSEAVRIGQEEEDEAAAVPVPGGDQVPLPFERRKTAVALPRLSAARWWPAAAAAVLVLGVGAAVYRSLVARPTISTPQIVTSLRDVPDLFNETIHSPVQRGVGHGTSTSSVEAFQLGVLEVDLELSLKAEDGKAAEEVCRQIGNAINDDPMLTDQLPVFRAVRDLKSGKLPPDLPTRLRNALATAQPSLSPLYADFGRWAEAGRLSTITGDHGFFKKRDNRRLLDWLLNKPAQLEDPDLRDQEVDFPPQVKEALERIAALWDDHATKSIELKGAFKDIIDYYFQPAQGVGPLDPD